MGAASARTSLVRLALGAAFLLLGFVLASMTSARADDVGLLGTEGTITRVVDSVAAVAATPAEGTSSEPASRVVTATVDVVESVVSTPVAAVEKPAKAVQVTVAEPVKEPVKAVTEPVKQPVKAVAAAVAEPVAEVAEVAEVASRPTAAVATTVTPVVKAVTAPVVKTVEPIVAPVTGAVLAPATAVIEPVLTVVDPVLTVVDPVLTVVDPVLTVVDPVLTVVQPVLTVVVPGTDALPTRPVAGLPVNGLVPAPGVRPETAGPLDVQGVRTPVRLPAEAPVQNVSAITDRASTRPREALAPESVTSAFLDRPMTVARATASDRSPRGPAERPVGSQPAVAAGSSTSGSSGQGSPDAATTATAVTLGEASSATTTPHASLVQPSPALDPGSRPD